MKERLDNLLVKRALAETRAKAKIMIMEGNVFVNNQREDKAGTMFKDDVLIEIKGQALKYVSRGGFKLEKAVEEWKIDLNDKVCMDIGSIPKQKLCGSKEFCYGDKCNVNTCKIDLFFNILRGYISDIGFFHRNYSWITPKLPSELIRTNIHCKHLSSTVLKHTIRKTSGRRTNIHTNLVL